MIEITLYLAVGFGIFAAGLYVGTMTERKARQHTANRAKTLHPCRTYTTTASNVTVTWGDNA